MREAPLMEHLEELRNRLIWAIVAWAVATGIAFTFRTQLIDFLRHPLDIYNLTAKKQAVLQVIDVTEAFVTAFKIAAYGGLILAFPFIVYQIWAFIAPGLYKHERRMAVPFLLGAGFSFGLGSLFAYFIFLPGAVPVLLSFLGDSVQPNISIGRYMGFVLSLLAMTGLIFEMPVVSYLLARLGFLSARFLASNWRIAVVILISVAAVVTPTTDVFSLSLFSVPLFLLFWISVLVARIAERQRPREIEQSPV